MKKVLLLVAGLMLVASSAFAANFGLIPLQATIADTTSLKVDNVTGATAPTNDAGTVNAAAFVASNKTVLTYQTNMAAFQLLVMNASHTASSTNAAENYKIDGLVDYSQNTTALLSSSQVPLYVTANTSATAPAVGAAGWVTVQDAQYWPWYSGATLMSPLWNAAGANYTGANGPLMADSVRTIKSGSQQLAAASINVWYKVGFSATTSPAQYTAIVQYSMATQ